jgi:hypothetical protein
MPKNSSVRGPKHRIKRSKTPVLTADEARTLLDSIDGLTQKPLSMEAALSEGLRSATIPGQKAVQIVRFRIRATDANAARASALSDEDGYAVY